VDSGDALSYAAEQYSPYLKSSTFQIQSNTRKGVTDYERGMIGSYQNLRKPRAGQRVQKLHYQVEEGLSTVF